MSDKSQVELQNELQKGIIATPTVTDSSMYLGKTPEQWQDFGRNGGLVGDGSIGGDLLKNQINTNLNSVAPGTNWWESKDLGMQGLGGTAVGLGQLGIGIMGYLDQKETADKQRALMDQQLASNAYTMQKRKADSASLAKAFGTDSASRLGSQ